MGKYVLVYRGGSAPDGEAAQKAVMDAWMAWFGELGDAIVDGGAPFMASKTRTGSGPVTDSAPSELTGYSVVSANDLAAASEMAGGCPILADGGSVDIYEAHEM